MWVSGIAPSSVCTGEAVCAAALYKWGRDVFLRRLRREESDSGAMTCPKPICTYSTSKAQLHAYSVQIS